MRAVCVNGRQSTLVSCHHRGLHYADGLFETLRTSNGEAPLWPLHWERLARGARVLGLRLPDQTMLQETLHDMAGSGPALAKLLVSRAVSGRGYRGQADRDCEWLLMVDDFDADAYPAQLDAIVCDTRLAVQPLLAGLKHLGRLEQVLAQAECARAGVAEGLMCDTLDSMTCASSGNLFMRVGETWYTPMIDRAGVAGVCRRWLLELGDAFPVQVARLSVAELQRASEVFVCNALHGPRALVQIDATRYPVGADTQRMAQAWRKLFVEEKQ